jgi:hypothetical protein
MVVLTRLLDRLPFTSGSRRWRVAASVLAADEVPDHLPALTATLVGTQVSPKWLAFDCPCGRGHRIMLNLDPARRPVWRLAKTNPLSLQPSVDVAGPPRCHFYLSRGRVTWIKGLRSRGHGGER